MECNKDEAIRAMDIAKRKVTENDYSMAKTFAVKAQNLYPQLDGLKQVLMLIDVYISAGNKVNGGEPDWYGVLGVDPLADDGVVKKQYRKLALLLHPDKNKCDGAEGAFKLVLEAWCLLSDKVKRFAFDQKRRVVVKEVKPRKSRKQKQEPKEPKQPTKKQKQPAKEPKQPAKRQPPKQPKQPAKQQKQPAKQQKQPANQQEQPPKQQEQPANQQKQPPNQQEEQPANQQEQPPKQQEQPANQQEQPPKPPKQPENQQEQPAKEPTQQANEQQQPPKQPKEPPKPPKQPANQQEQRPNQQKQQPSPQKQQPRQPSSSVSRTGRSRSNKPTSKVSTFWTMCNICGKQYQYIRVYYLNKNLTCQNCHGSFTATEIEKTQQATKDNTNGAFCGRDSLSRKASSNVVEESKDKDEEAARGIANSDFKEERARKKLKTGGSCRGK